MTSKRMSSYLKYKLFNKQHSSTKLKKLFIALSATIVIFIVSSVIIIGLLVSWGLGKINQTADQLNNIKDQTSQKLQSFTNSDNILKDYQEQITSSRFFDENGVLVRENVEKYFQNLPNEVADSLVAQQLKMSIEELANLFNINIDQAKAYLEILQALSVL